MKRSFIQTDAKRQSLYKVIYKESLYTDHLKTNWVYSEIIITMLQVKKSLYISILSKLTSNPSS